MVECSVQIFERDVKPVLSRPGGVIGQLNTNLRERKLEPFVEIFEGDFRDLDVESFDFIFSDAMHNEAEITSNVYDTVRKLKPGGILACHDIDDANFQVLTGLVNYDESVRIEELHVGVVAGIRTPGS